MTMLRSNSSATSRRMSRISSSGKSTERVLWPAALVAGAPDDPVSFTETSGGAAGATVTVVVVVVLAAGPSGEATAGAGLVWAAVCAFKCDGAASSANVADMRKRWFLIVAFRFLLAW
jgi:hypothetical protein